MAEEFSQAREVVGVDEIDAGVVEFGPGGFGVRGGPEAKFAVFGVGLGDDGLQFFALSFGKFSHAFPGEVGIPIVADQGHEAEGKIFAEIGEASVEGGEAGFFAEENFTGAVAADDDCDGVGVNAI